MGSKRNFQDKVVFLTGAAGGLGRAMARVFGRAGARICLTDLDGPAAAALAEELKSEGHDCLGLPLDVTSEEECRAAVNKAVEHFGRLDVLINNAGLTHRSPFVQTEARVFHRVMAVNFFGSLYCTQAALGHLIPSRGLIIVISSIAGLAPLLGRTGYSASKHALHGLFESLRTELTGAGVAVMIVCPGFTRTNIDKNALDGDGRPTSHPQSTVGRVASPESVAHAILAAASREKRLLVLSTVGRLTYWLTRLCPGLYEKIMARAVASELQRG
ncbi:MAG: SDR family oxidoreductase [Thermodesulfobacteriota bacterium]